MYKIKLRHRSLRYYNVDNKLSVLEWKGERTNVPLLGTYSLYAFILMSLISKRILKIGT